jgi:hypothetical protein
MIVLKDRSARDQDPTMVGQDHGKCVELFSSLRKLIDTDARHVESQQPLVCSEIHEPEPDFMVLRGTLESYLDLPTAADAYCVVEVADSSYERDSGEKLIGYARANVQQYIIVNLRSRQAEVYSQPNSETGTYGAPQIVSSDESILLRVAEDEFLPLPLANLLP